MRSARTSRSTGGEDPERRSDLENGRDFAASATRGYPVALAHAANDTGRLHEDGRLEIDAPKARPWLRGLASGNSLELLCPMIGLAEAEPLRPAQAAAP